MVLTRPKDEDADGGAEETDIADLGLRIADLLNTIESAINPQSAVLNPQ